MLVVLKLDCYLVLSFCLLHEALAHMSSVLVLTRRDLIRIHFSQELTIINIWSFASWGGTIWVLTDL